jgi:hypothetical protein
MLAGNPDNLYIQVDVIHYKIEIMKFNALIVILPILASAVLGATIPKAKPILEVNSIEYFLLMSLVVLISLFNGFILFIYSNINNCHGLNFYSSLYSLFPYLHIHFPYSLVLFNPCILCLLVVL